MKAFILAGGMGTRLASVINDRPKVMAPITGEKTFLEYLFDLLKKNNIDEIVLGVGYLSKYVQSYFGDGAKFGVKIEYSDEDYPLGTAGAIRNAQDKLGDTFLVLNGDTYLDFDIAGMIDFHKKQKAEITMAVTQRPHHWGGLIEMKGDDIINFESNPLEDDASKVNPLTSVGFYVFEKSVVSDINLHKMSLEKQLFPLLIDTGHKIVGFHIEKGDFVEVGTAEGYFAAKGILGSNK